MERAGLKPIHRFRPLSDGCNATMERAGRGVLRVDLFGYTVLQRYHGEGGTINAPMVQRHLLRKLQRYHGEGGTLSFQELDRRRGSKLQRYHGEGGT